VYIYGAAQNVRPARYDIDLSLELLVYIC